MVLDGGVVDSTQTRLYSTLDTSRTQEMSRLALSRALMRCNLSGNGSPRQGFPGRFHSHDGEYKMHLEDFWVHCADE